MVRYIKVPLGVDERGGEGRGGEGRGGEGGGTYKRQFTVPCERLGFAVTNDSRELREKTHHSFVVLEMGF